MPIGNFCLSLAVKDLKASESFYENLGYNAVGGDSTQGWLVLSDGASKIGLFQGMFDKNMLTFNPGWNQKGEALEAFEDI